MNNIPTLSLKKLLKIKNEKYGCQKNGRCGEGNTTTTLSLHRTSAIIGGAK